MRAEPPPPSVLSAFGASGPSIRLAGGRGSSWRSGGVVLKPVAIPESELAWQAQVFASISCDGFRVARPVAAPDGSFVVDGWAAWEAVAGRHEERRWADIIAVGDRFHVALAGLRPPDFIRHRTDPWAIGDRVAWGEVPASQFAHVRHVARLVAALEPIDAPSRLVHGDLTGNVLFHDRLAPAVIDFSPYWRPAPFASAVVVADALVWEGADERIFAAVAHVEDFAQYLLRALTYRVVTDSVFASREPTRARDPDPYAAAVGIACRLAARTG